MTGALVGLLPPPSAGALTIYVFGPRPGESVALALPEGSWVVVDTCRQDGRNLALDLLQRFGPARVALAALTHPDADHYRGFADLIAVAKPERVWTFPHLVARKELLAYMARRNPRDARARELTDALAAVDAAMLVNAASPVHAVQRKVLGSTTVHCVGPCPADVANEERLIRELLARAAAGDLITDAAGYLLRGESLDGSGNPISLALVVEWGTLRFCLAGDVEAPASSHRGWNGIIDYVDAECGVDILRDVQVLKVAHHASIGAFSGRAFALHAETRRIPLAIATPFSSGPSPPPHPAALREIRKNCARLAITSEPVCSWTAIEPAGWLPDQSGVDEGASCVVATCGADGAIDVSLYGGARSFC